MPIILLLSLILLSTDAIVKSDSVESAPFITTWKTNLPGASGDSSIIIPTAPSSTYNYNVKWGDGSVSTNLSGNATHTYDEEGTFTVEITGVFPRIYFNDSGDKEKIISIDQWGNSIWQEMAFAFYGCTNLKGNANDKPNLSSVNSMVSMFRNASSFDQDINDWDVSGVTNMWNTFNGAALFNQNIYDWDVSNVTRMSGMFANATSFNQDIGNWDVTSVTSIENMFFNSIAFNQDISNWQISSLSDLATFLTDSGLDMQNYDALLIGWAGQSVQQNVNFGVHGLEYCSGEFARELLIAQGWAFEGDSKANDTNIFNFNFTHWNLFPSSWSEGRYPSCCDDVIIPQNKSITIIPGDIGYGGTLEVELGASLDVPLGAELHIKGN